MHKPPYKGRASLLRSAAMMRTARFAAVIAAACVLANGAFADPYKVKDLVLDKVAPSAAQAVQQGSAEARLAGAQRLIERLTLPEDRAAAREPIDVNFVATRLARNFETQEQTKSFPAPGGFRSTGVLTWNFDAKAVRDYLDRLGVPFVDTQAAKALIVPAVAGGLDRTSWGAVWTQGVMQNGQMSLIGRSDDTVLTPYIASVESWDRRPAFMDVQAEITRAGADHAIVAEAISQNGQIHVRLIDLRINAATPEILIGPFADLESARQGVIAAMERAWKMQSIVRTSGSTDASIIASFEDINEWVKIRRGLETSRLIKGLTVDSLSASGADLRFSYAGRPEQLVADLRSRGLNLSNTNNFWIVQVVEAQ